MGYRSIRNSRRDRELKGLLGEARAIHLAMTCNQISYERAKYLTKPLLQEINTEIEVIAKKYGKKPRLLKFQDLGSRF